LLRIATSDVFDDIEVRLPIEINFLWRIASVHKRPIPPSGVVQRIYVESGSLIGNALDDPSRRAIDVYVPAGHDGAGLPLLIDLAGFTGSGLGRTAWKNFGENMPERLDRLIAEGQMPPAVVAFPDAFTRLGGNQYLNSPVFGQWEDFLAGDMLTALETRFNCGGTGRRGLFGKSSGGYGALMNAMRRPDVWSAAACHSGDMAFELCYLPDMPIALRALARHGGSAEGFVHAFEDGDRPAGSDIHALMILAMAATYDPDPSVPFGIRLPVTLDTCELIPERWSVWLQSDPIVAVGDHVDALRSLSYLFVDCGDSDQYNLLYGARRFHRRLSDLNVNHLYEEFAGTHSGIDYRLDVSLPAMATALSTGQ
jgi:poly(3-hydroxybutyrate) depolymerase